MPQLDNRFENKIIIGLISLVLLLASTSVTIGFWAGSVKSELVNVKKKQESKVDLNVYETNNQRVDSIILQLNNTDRLLTEDIKYIRLENKEDHKLILDKIENLNNSINKDKK